MTCDVYQSPWSRHIGEGDVVIPDTPEGGQDLGEGSHYQVLAVPAQSDCQEDCQVIVSQSQCYSHSHSHSHSHSLLEVAV